MQQVALGAVEPSGLAEEWVKQVAVGAVEPSGLAEEWVKQVALGAVESIGMAEAGLVEAVAAGGMGHSASRQLGSCCSSPCLRRSPSSSSKTAQRCCGAGPRREDRPVVPPPSPRVIPPLATMTRPMQRAVAGDDHWVLLYNSTRYGSSYHAVASKYEVVLYRLRTSSY